MEREHLTRGGPRSLRDTPQISLASCCTVDAGNKYTGRRLWPTLASTPSSYRREESPFSNRAPQHNPAALRAHSQSKLILME